jgi:hypothetical protein
MHMRNMEMQQRINTMTAPFIASPEFAVGVPAMPRTPLKLAG